jgi:hypothetical protein
MFKMNVRNVLKVCLNVFRCSKFFFFVLFISKVACYNILYLSCDLFVDSWLNWLVAYGECYFVWCECYDVQNLILILP